MSISSGIGDDVGRSPMPSVFENETTGRVNIARERLGIVRDTLQLSFVEIDGRTEGPLWRYLAKENRPILPPLISTRMQTPELGASDTTWTTAYEELLDALPTLVREKLEYDSKQPLEERDPAYIALGDVLTATAKALARIRAAKEPVTPGSIESRYAEFNSLLPLFSANATVEQGKAFFDKAREYLDAIGANYQHIDKLSDTIRQAQYSLDNLQRELNNGP